eukprot:772021-Prymnesium_polylepis.1
MSDAVDGRSAARCRNRIVRQNVTFPQIPATLACGTRPRRDWADRPTRRKPRWTAKCRFYKRVNYSRRNATLTSP